MEHPDLTWWIHEITQNDRETCAVALRRRRVPSLLTSLRSVAGNGLIAIGNRIAPAPCPAAPAAPVLKLPARP